MTKNNKRKLRFYGIRDECCKLGSNLNLYDESQVLYQCIVCKRLHKGVLS